MNRHVLAIESQVGDKATGGDLQELHSPKRCSVHQKGGQLHEGRVCICDYALL